MPISSAHLSWWQAVAQTGQNTPVSSRISRPRPFAVAHVSSDASLLWNKRLLRPVQKTSPPLGVANQVCPFRTSTSRSKCDFSARVGFQRSLFLSHGQARTRLGKALQGWEDVWMKRVLK